MWTSCGTFAWIVTASKVGFLTVDWLQEKLTKGPSIKTKDTMMESISVPTDVCQNGNQILMLRKANLGSVFSLRDQIKTSEELLALYKSCFMRFAGTLLYRGPWVYTLRSVGEAIMRINRPRGIVKY